MEIASPHVVSQETTVEARELKQAPENAEQDILTAASRQLFHLHRAQAALTSR